MNMKHIKQRRRRKEQDYYLCASLYLGGIKRSRISVLTGLYTQPHTLPHNHTHSHTQTHTQMYFWCTHFDGFIILESDEIS